MKTCQKFSKYNYPLLIIILAGSLFHILFFYVNEILKNADSFAYLQMSYHFKNLSLEGFGTGWFGFLYSLLIAIFDTGTFWLNEYYIALYLNIILFGTSAFLLYKIGVIYLKKSYNLLLISLFYLSSILLHFNIGILSENIYIPLFLGLVLFLINRIQNVEYRMQEEKIKYKTKNIFIISLFIALLYLTRAEAFIYLGSIFIVLFFNSINFKKIKASNFIDFFKKSTLIVIFFFLLISPYLLYLHSITGDWGLTNKGSSNLRQAELRGSEKMDDEGFEQAVGELTIDNHHLKSGFVGGLKYEKGEEKGGLKDYLLANPQGTVSRILGNQVKLYTRNLPDMIVGDAIKLYQKSYLFIPILIIPLLLVLFGIYKMFIKREYEFLIIFFSFFSVASLFFTLFFVLNRYFLIFLPLFLILMVYAIQEIKCKIQNIKYMIIILVLGIYLIGDYVYYNNVKGEDYKYGVKKVAGEFLRKQEPGNGKSATIKILERFPIVTYYSGTKERWITPFTDNLDNLIEYAKYNKIDYLVVDTLDFKTYRPKLDFLLNDNFQNKSLHKIQTFQVNKEKVILYKFTF